MRRVAAQPLVFSGVHRSRRQLGDDNGLVVVAEAESAGHAFGAGTGRIECRHRRDMFAIQLKVTGDRLQPIQLEHLGLRFDAEASRLMREPNSARLVAGRRGPVSALRIPRGQPRNRARCGLLKTME